MASTSEHNSGSGSPQQQQESHNPASSSSTNNTNNNTNNRSGVALMGKKLSGVNLASVGRAALRGRTATMNALHHLNRSPNVSSESSEMFFLSCFENACVYGMLYCVCMVSACYYRGHQVFSCRSMYIEMCVVGPTLPHYSSAGSTVSPFVPSPPRAGERFLCTLLF